MDMDKLLKDEIRSEFEKLKVMEPGTEEHKTTVEGLTKLVDRAIEIDKLSIEHDNTIEKMKEDRFDRYIKYGLEGASYLIPAGIAVWGTIKSLEFEKTGSVTTIMGRGFINSLLPRSRR